METMCQACNGLMELTETCPQCGGKMVDGGRVDFYSTPYSPYFPDVQSFAAENCSAQHNRCIHIMTCKNCGHDKRTAVPLLTM